MPPVGDVVGIVFIIDGAKYDDEHLEALEGHEEDEVKYVFENEGTERPLGKEDCLFHDSG